MALPLIYLSAYLSRYLSVCLSVYLPTYGSTALEGLGHFFSLQDSLDGGSDRRKATAYTQNNTNTE
jgi:hypothetical protein